MGELKREVDDGATFHEELSAYWQEGRDLKKLDFQRILDRMPRKLKIMKTTEGDTEHELWLYMTEPFRKKIEVISLVHVYHKTREDGLVVSGSEMLYLDANVTTNSLKPLRDGLTKIIGDEMVQQQQSGIISASTGGTKYQTHDTFYYLSGLEQEQVPFTDANILIEYDNGEQAVASSRTAARDIEKMINHLRIIAPLGARDSEGRTRKAYLIQHSRTFEILRRVTS